MKKFFQKLIAIVMVVTVSVGFVSCGSYSDENEDDMGGGLVGWYTDLDHVAKTSDFNVINEAINNNEELSSYRYDGQYHKHYASYDEFIDIGGRYHDYEASFGRLRFTISDPINAIRIVDDKTLIFYSASLYVDGNGKGTAVYKLYAGPIFGNMTYYDTGTYYTYAMVENKLVVSNGDIYTIVDGGLIKDGSSQKWSKYDPTKRN